MILLNSGYYFDFNGMESSPIELEDIASALSLINRFGGHTPRPYSVAQHSLFVASMVPKEHRLQALLHDATEAYIGDVVKPLKNMLPAYVEMENRLQGIIMRQFELPEELHSSIKEADIRVLKTEQRDILGNSDRWIDPHKPYSDDEIWLAGIDGWAMPTNHDDMAEIFIDEVRQCL